MPVTKISALKGSVVNSAGTARFVLRAVVDPKNKDSIGQP